MDNIFKYIDYRQYLAEYYEYQKANTTHFSYRYFSNKAGIKSPNFLKQVIDGDRNLTSSMVEKFISALKLNKKESVYFRNLVNFNQAKTAAEKQEYYSVILSMSGFVKEHQLTEDQYAYYKNWYNVIVRELVTLADFKNNYSLIGDYLEPPISREEVVESLELMVRLELLKKQNGQYVHTEPALNSGQDKNLALARRSFNKKMIELAAESLNKFEINERYAAGVTMGISKSCYDVILAEFSAFKERVIAIVDKDKDSSRVYQMNLQLYPVSRDVTDIKHHSDNIGNR